MAEVKISTVDKYILNAKSHNKSDIFLDKLSSLIFSYLNKSEEKSTSNRELFDKGLNQKNKRFIAYCLLRVYSLNSSLLTEGLVKHKIFKLIEDSTPEVYKYLKIDDKTESYQKESHLSSYVTTVENKINESIIKEFDLRSVKTYRKSILASINQRPNKFLLDDFADFSIVNKYLDLLFDLLLEYVEGDPINKYKTYNRIIKLLYKIIDSSEEVDTKYSIDYCCKPFKKIKNGLIQDFASNPNSKPADLHVLKTEKKYPIIPNVKHKLQFRIENKSTGFANDTKMYIKDVTNIQLIESSQFVGQVKTFALLSFDYIGTKVSDSLIIEGFVEWVNFDGKKCKNDFFIELDSQNSNIEWQQIESIEPYDLEAVTNEEEFIGRKKIINALKKIGKKVGSSYIFGQRRVGKTSIVKTIQSSIKSDNLLIIYLEAGDWCSATSPQKSMNDLGRKICNKIIKSHIKYKYLSVPEFSGSFNSITDFLDEISEIDSEYKVLIILDEFDRITNNLLYPGDIAKSFLLTIRSISNRDQFGFVLVGGEKMEYILSQWQEFNKFKPIRIDYFDKKSEWEDFKNLIRIPVKGMIEISDKAIDYLYKQTSGNPYFTKKICIELFQLMVENRDSHATEEETKQATQNARSSNNIAATDFSHFWMDGIKEKEAKEEEISINRRKVLLALGQLLESKIKTTKQSVIDKSMASGLNVLEAEKTLDEFVQRKIIKIDTNEYSFVVKFFEDWLISHGLNKIITTFEEEQRLILRKQYEDTIKVSSSEINLLAQSWPNYRSNKVSNDAIRSWLEQFGGFEEQRSVFGLLSNLKVYDTNEVREKMEDLFHEVRKEIAKSKKIVYKEQGKLKRDDILVSYLDKNPAKSGPEYAKIFVETNNIYKDNSTNPDKIDRKLIELKNINSLVFVDDFVGSGNSIIENLKPILLVNKDEIKKRNIIVIIGVITGFEEAKHKILKFAKKEEFAIEVKLLDPLNNNDKCFDDNSLIYPKPIEREKAKRICEKIGVKLEKRHPLGYGNCQATVVFPTTCPNNSLPILWKETTDWKPLFKRG
ncbi:AAA family ATPase [Algibacter sp. L1A34]|uniref:phosphoribosyltransferase-like protein n=1 Tax=Algibacter sp. L1A34 TaxID=2686365 RepID=UPI00131E0F48|nr:ATP-binding protein [Algibacter sp. L1A34]